MTADETIIGFYDIETTTDVVITPYNGETQVTVAEKNIDEAASNVNGDDKIDVKDAIVIRRYIAGGYGIEL